MTLAEVLDTLNYSQSIYYLKTGQKHEPEVASLFRAAYNAGVDGIYVFQTSSEKHTLVVKPAVYVAEAQTPEEARKIHRKLWNLGQAPFLIIVLPNEIRVYTGFDYSQNDDGVGAVEPPVPLDRGNILDRLGDFCAEAINNGQIWNRRSEYLKPERRVDRRLLKNLEALGEFLREEKRLLPHVAHALIGKYVYIRYLRDRGIISDQWFAEHTIDIEAVLGSTATVNSLRRLCAILDERFNGSIFPLDFDSKDAPGDEHVELVAAIFKGDKLLRGGGRQLSLPDFQAYDFAYIPIELLSSIYEQFLRAEDKGRQVGAYYTPVYLADYLISEMNVVNPLREGMTILDPSCGSGIFLVLIYARLIEMRLAQAESVSTLPLPELLKLLTYIYGIEREADACYVTEFSLILMLLHYADVSEFLHDERFKLPSLHNKHIFQNDFFDDSSQVWIQDIHFDWIIGNPPWIKADTREEPFATTWINANKKQRPVDNNSVAGAFSWHVLDLLSSEGYAGLILPAPLLYNHRAEGYRQSFFEHCEVRRITNFSNLRGQLFEGRATAAAITMIYHLASAEQEKLPIEHYGPFAINQITKSDNGKLWTITINEQEYQGISPYEAAHGDSATWKIALWGSHRDKRAIARLRKLFPLTLEQLEEQNDGWHLSEGPQLRHEKARATEELEHIPELVGKKQLDISALKRSHRRFSIPDEALENIPPEECNIRSRGGKKGLLVAEPPHLIINDAWNYIIYSDAYFVIKPRTQIGLSVPQADAHHLRALSVFLNSNLVEYYMFFQSPRWGIERDVITLETVKSIPVPVFTSEQIVQLAALQKTLVSMELEQGSRYAQDYLNRRVIDILQIPESITALVSEFLQLRVGLVGGGTREAVQKVQQRPDQKALTAYAQQLVTSLDGFLDSGRIHHRVTIEQSPDLICCKVDFVRSEHAFEPLIKDVSSQNGRTFHQLQQNLKQEFSQWVYVQRGLKMFGSSSISLYKMPHLINWTRTQAMNDADDIIAETLSMERRNDVRQRSSIRGK